MLNETFTLSIDIQAKLDEAAELIQQAYELASKRPEDRIAADIGEVRREVDRLQGLERALRRAKFA